jgi:integral membrane protein (TIGR01906 family)
LRAAEAAADAAAHWPVGAPREYTAVRERQGGAVADEIKLDNSGVPEENASVAAAGRQRETHMGFARMLATIAFVVALPIALLTTNIRLLVNAPLVYSYAFDRYDAEDTTGLARSELDGVASALRDYFNNGEKTFFHTVSEDGLTGPVFSARETRHMEDVKSLLVKVNRAQEISSVYVLVYVVAFFIWAREGNVRQLAAQSLAGLGLGLIVVGGAGVVALFGFDAASERFHNVAFSNDFWRLNPQQDHLIQMFPEAFWRDMTILLGAMCAIEAGIIAAISAIYLLSTRSERRRLAAAVDVKASTQAA